MATLCWNCDEPLRMETDVCPRCNFDWNTVVTTTQPGRAARIDQLTAEIKRLQYELSVLLSSE